MRVCVSSWAGTLSGKVDAVYLDRIGLIAFLTMMQALGAAFYRGASFWHPSSPHPS